MLTTLIAVPMGVAFAIGIDRWRGPMPGTLNLVMMFSFVIPELIFGVAMFFVFTGAVHLGPPWAPLAEVPGPGHLERPAGRR